MPAQAAGAGTISRRWIATTAATLCSTYLLDLVATAAGVALVASGLLAEADHARLLPLLALSYLAWGLCLRASLAANWALIRRTGTSTCLPSKLAHDLVRRVCDRPRARRLAAAAGYVGTELAKEAPYYGAAFGALFIAEAVSPADAFVFLAGANLGAAAYELALARGVRTFLGHADFDTDWDPRAYLAGYYARVEPDERETIAFFVDGFRRTPEGGSVLVFGIGPTLHHVFPAAERAGEIHLGEYLPANRAEAGRWLAGAPDAYDWRPFVHHTLACEGHPATAAGVAERERLVRARVTRLLPVDLRRLDPLGAAQRTYDTVVSAYCADSATADRATWALYMRRIASLVAPGGTLLVAALRHATGYRVGPHLFPSADIGEDDMRAVLGVGFDVVVETRDLPEQRRHGYGGIILARARRADLCRRFPQS